MLSEKDVIGVWRLVSHYYLDEDGSTSEGPLGVAAEGLLIYEAAGYMAASVMRTAESATSSATYLGTSADYLGYSGRWWLEGQDGVVVHDVVVGSQPRVVRTRQLREARLIDGRLLLSRRLEGTRSIVMDWERV